MAGYRFCWRPSVEDSSPIASARPAAVMPEYSDVLDAMMKPKMKPALTMRIVNKNFER
jgi:hypothetical protein